MIPEPTITAAASSWVGLFAAIWFARDATDGAPRPSRSRRRRTSPIVDLGGASRARVDLYLPTPSARTGPRFDVTVAFPIDTPYQLDATIATVSRRLQALPDLKDLGRRTISYRAQLQRILRQAIRARARLDAGIYGICVDCSAPISLSALIEKPWTAVCAWCAADS